MKQHNLLPAKNRNELRAWLEKNYDKEPECWVVVKRGRPKEDGTFRYADAVEEAMCFGWIDSATKNSTRDCERMEDPAAGIEKGKASS